MNEELKDILSKYKMCTLEIIKIVEEDNLDFLQQLIEKRQELVDKALSIPCEKEESKEIYKSLQLDEIQMKLNTLISNRLEDIKSEIKKISKSKKANNSYNKGYSKAMIFSKKI